MSVSHATGPAATARAHTVHFYEHDDTLVETLAIWATEGLARGEGLLCIATAAHRDALSARLREAGIDPGAIVHVDAAEARDFVAPGGLPSREAFRDIVRKALAKARAASRRGVVRAFGEIVDLLVRANQPDVAITLEGFWNELGAIETFSLLCGYCRAGIGEGSLLQQVCRTHEEFYLPEDPANRVRLLEREVRARIETEIQLREALEKQRETEQALRQSRAELEDFVENAVEGLHWVGADGTILWANKAELSILGYTKDEYVGRNIAEFHVDGALLDDILTRLSRNEILHNQAARMRAKDGTIRHVLIDSNVRWVEGRFAHTCCFTRDVTDLERVRQRAAFLHDASEALSASLDIQTTASTVARLAVPRVADACVVEILDDAVGVEDSSTVEHVDPAKRAMLVEHLRRNPLGGVGAGRRGRGAVLRSGRAEHIPDVHEVEGDLTDEGRELANQIGLRSVITVPMIARGRAIGVLALHGGPERVFQQGDVDMAEELGRRAAMSIDNARLYRDARVADQRKDEFLAVLSHELRNPLAPILTALQLMQLRSAGSDRERAVIERQVRHLERLVGDLLDISRITRGKIQLRCERVEIGQVVAKAVEMASPMLEQRNHRLTMDVPREGLPVHADAVRLSQVIANLLTNAAKFTDAGGDIRISAARTGNEITVRVADDGIGIAPDMLPRIFDLFVQGERILDRASGGLGIGLSLARSLTDLHGGRIEARSEGAGKGSEFRVTLPVDDGTRADAAKPHPAGIARAKTARRVLVVDDNVDAAQMIAESLRLSGHEVCIAHDGPHALALAAQGPLDLAVLDIGLPVMDGYELARRLRAIDGRAQLRLVAISGYGQESDRVRSAEAGIELHLVKPVDLDRLLDAIA